MKTKEFNDLMDAQIERVRNTLGNKAEEYAVDGDRLHNFQQAADLQGISLREALGGFMAKHTVSIYDMIRDQEPHDMDMWDEKITDHMAYLILLNAVIKEESFERKGLSGGPTPLESIHMPEEKTPDEAVHPSQRVPTPNDLANRSPVNA